METILEEIIMKRKTILVSSVTAILLAGIFIWYTLPVDLMDLDHKEVLELVVFNGSSGNATHITDKEQIQHIIDDLNDVEIKRTRPSMGYSGYGYKLSVYLSDGNEAGDWKTYNASSGQTLTAEWGKSYAINRSEEHTSELQSLL